MRIQRLLLFILVFTLDSFCQNHAASIIPISADQIQLLQNRIVLTFSGTWYVEMTATYKNLGPDQTVKMGFPYKQILPYNYEEMLSLSVSEREYETDFYDPLFKTYVNEKSIPVSAKRNWEHPELEKIDFSTVFTFEVPFDQGEVKTISHTYTTAGFEINFYEDDSYIVFLEPSALWKGKIKLFEIEMRHTENYGLEIITPPEHSCILDESDKQISLKWKFSDFEPDFNIEVIGLKYKEKNRTLDQQIKDSDLFVKKYGQGGLRYLRNLVYAHYGYPFSNPLMRAIYYKSGRYSENENYSETYISSYHKEFLNKLKEMEYK